MFKNTLLFCVMMWFTFFNFSCKAQNHSTNDNTIKTGAEQAEIYLPLLKDKKVGVLTNQTGVIVFNEIVNIAAAPGGTNLQKATKTTHLIDFLIDNKVKVSKIYAPEHGFRGTADAGELIKDGKDTKTGLPIISLYGKSKKPSKDQLGGIDVMVFDLQDVGVRFYTYISSLHYLMEACAENNIPVIVLDRPNPIGSKVDGPKLDMAHKSFVGMHPIPVLHGLTIGEYAQMINGEKWLENGIQCHLTVIPCANYDKNMSYSLPVKPSPNLPNDHSIQMYASLCFFEGTNVSMGRGTDKQFQIYGSPYLGKQPYTFVPKPNDGAKDPVHNGKKCFGEDLSNYDKKPGLELKWLVKAYQATSEKQNFFNSFFTNLAGTKNLRSQIEKGWSAEKIQESWSADIEEFKNIRKKYLIYKE